MFEEGSILGGHLDNPENIETYRKGMYPHSPKFKYEELQESLDEAKEYALDVLDTTGNAKEAIGALFERYEDLAVKMAMTGQDVTTPAMEENVDAAREYIESLHISKAVLRSIGEEGKLHPPHPPVPKPKAHFVGDVGTSFRRQGEMAEKQTIELEQSIPKNISDDSNGNLNADRMAA